MAKKAMARGNSIRGFYKAIKARRHSFQPAEVAPLLAQMDRDRVEALSEAISHYVVTNMPEAIERREGLAEYRTNPYVLLTSASLMQLVSSDQFASFVFNNKLYMGLETSFGKSIESVLVLPYPAGAVSSGKWKEPSEKVEESKSLAGLARGKGPAADRLGCGEKSTKHASSAAVGTWLA